MSLKNKTISGVVWTLSDAIFVKGFSFISMILLARWIGPSDFGLIGMIAVFVSIGNSLVDSGMTSSLIRTKNPNQSDYSTVFFVNIFLSLIVYIIIYFLAPHISDFFGYYILTDVIRLYSLIFLVLASSAVQLAILTKLMNFRRYMIINIPSTIIGAILGLYLGYNNFGVWSIVWMYLCTEIVKAVYFGFLQVGSLN